MHYANILVEGGAASSWRSGSLHSLSLNHSQCGSCTLFTAFDAFMIEVLWTLSSSSASKYQKLAKITIQGHALVEWLFYT